MKIVIPKDKLFLIGFGCLVFLNYLFEASLIWGAYSLMNHWYTSGQEMFWWIFWAFFLMFIRYAVTCDKTVIEDWQQKVFSAHIYFPYLFIKYLLKKVPLSVEVK